MSGHAHPAGRKLPSLRSYLRSWLDSVSVRLLFIILCSVVPLAAIGGVLAWHNYRLAVGASTVRASVVAQALKAQTDQQVADLKRTIVALAAEPALRDPARCRQLLLLTRTLQPAMVDSVSFVDAAGRDLCAPSSGPTEPGQADPAITVTPLLHGNVPGGQPLMRLSMPAVGVGGSGILSIDMPLGRTRRDLADAELWHSRLIRDSATEAWLVGPAGELVPFCFDCGWNPADVDPRAAPARSHATGQFLRSDYLGDLGLLVATRPSKEESQALSIFLWRVVAIALMLTAGLVAVMIGASILIVSPLRAVTRSVTDWRRDGAYDPRPSRMTPIEMRQLSRVFMQATRAVQAHEARLRRAEAKQELLIKEIHHRVKNNLQIIASLLNLQANRIRQPEARAEFASARDRVRALATLHRHLYAEGELHTLNMRSFLEELCGQLFQAIGEKEGRRIRLEIDAPEIVMSTDQAVPVALVVTEAVSNAIKYAFPNGRSGLVSVTLTEDVEGIAKLVIQDDGIGIPAGRVETEMGVRDGLGIQLIRGFARQLAATLDVEEGEGTRYVLLVPLHPQTETAAAAAAEAEAAASA